MLSNQIKALINSLKTGDLSKFEILLYKITEKQPIISPESKIEEKLKNDFERYYYSTLSRFLSLTQFDDFTKLFNYSDKLGIFINVKKIPQRFKIISDLHLDGIRQGLVGRIFDIIRFYNSYDLFEREILAESRIIIEEVKEDKILIANLEDLFGRISDSLIYYISRIFPNDIYLMYLRNIDSLLDYEDLPEYGPSLNLNFLKGFTDRFVLYGLRYENLGKARDFVEHCNKVYLLAKQKGPQNDGNLFKIHYRNRTHLVSINNILKNYNNVIDNKDHYKFYSLSMVLLGGLGPQGHGFTYSTPRGELVEICSDRKENEAIIIKYKQFLRNQFLTKMNKELLNKGIEESTLTGIQEYLTATINEDQIISFINKDKIVEQVSKFLTKYLGNSIHEDSELENLVKKVSNAIKIILNPIRMIDQFLCRMTLVDEEKLKSEDIAKLTSLEGKSHYDVLRERYFFQNEINLFFRDFTHQIKDLEEKFLELKKKT
ncbi:MAG: hypothetical protein ACW986_18205 [Promethearchaeota archaeon]|jgi:hypothetical protein